jgi:hypothetical protein
MTDPLKQFLESIKENHRDLIVIFFGCIAIGYPTFLICDLIYYLLKDIIGFELDKFKKWYFNLRR